jgi:hypothetical protein
MKTNEPFLIRMAVQGQVMHPRCYGWEVTSDGTGAFLPAVGGITYNVRVGDPAFGWVADHVEPGVSLTASRDGLDKNPNKAFNAYSCVGNTARLISGAAKGKTGVVTGHHGGVEHVLVDFPAAVLKKMTEDDKVLIETFGSGFRLAEVPDIAFFSLDPGAFRKMKTRILKPGRLEVPVAAIVPPELMGSGVGSLDNFKGDYDIQTQDADALKEHGLDRLRLGDFVALRDQDNRYGIGYRKAAMSIGIVVHADSRLTGHGPGVQVLMTAATDVIVPRIDPRANLADRLAIGRSEPRPSGAGKRK